MSTDELPAPPQTVPAAADTPQPVPTSDSIPRSEPDYIEWAKSTLNIDFKSDRTRLQYKQTAAYAQNSLQEHQFFKGLDTFIKECGIQYTSSTRSPLLMTEAPVTFYQKTYDSAINKSFRQNCVLNKKFPEPPNSDGWVTPANWFSRFNDILRTTIVCKYIDGPKMLAESLQKHATAHKLKSRLYSQQSDDGHYAYHFYIFMPLDLVLENGDVKKIDIQVEIQLTTQLQEVLREMTHRFYENTRIVRREKDATAWKWEHQSSRFRTSYLSHTLHLLEAIIVELRDSANAATSPDEEGEQ